jgi:hypothetical protein
MVFMEACGRERIGSILENRPGKGEDTIVNFLRSTAPYTPIEVLFSSKLAVLQWLQIYSELKA